MRWIKHMTNMQKSISESHCHHIWAEFRRSYIVVRVAHDTYHLNVNHLKKIQVCRNKLSHTLGKMMFVGIDDRNKFEQILMMTTPIKIMF